MKTIINYGCLALCFLLLISPAFCANSDAFTDENNAYFIENKGQFKDIDNSKVCFVFTQGGFRYLLTNHGIFCKTIEICSPAAGDTVAHLDSYTYQVFFRDANPQMHIRGEIPKPYKENIYSEEFPDGIIDIGSFGKVVYNEIYPGIDMAFYFENNNLKYDFIVKPGAQPEKIKLEYSVKDANLSLLNGDLVLTTLLGTITEKKPYAYYLEEGTKKEVVCSYKLNNALLTFETSEFPKDKELVIDPYLVWDVSASNSFGDGYTVAGDTNGNLYVGGSVFGSDATFPGGGFQNTSGGGTDGYMIKLDSSHNEIWSTYYGGSSVEYVYDIAFDSINGFVYIAGTTQSTTAIASGGYDNTYAGATDAYLAKFTTAGVRIWGTYFGGTATETLNSLCVDYSGNIIIAGSTFSTSGLASGGFQTVQAGDEDNYVAKFAADGSLLWSTYYGATGEEDLGYACIDADNNVFLCGRTESSSGIAYAGYQMTFGGSSDDGFIVKFDAAGNRIWATYYGSTGQDQLRCVRAGRFGELYAGGYSSSSTGIAYNGFQMTRSNYFEAIIVKFGSDGNRKWATYYGGLGDEQCYEIRTDPNGYVYVAGESTSGPKIAKGIYNNAFYEVKGDGFVLKADTACNLIWSRNCTWGFGLNTSDLRYIDVCGDDYAHVQRFKNDNNAILALTTLGGSSFCGGDLILAIYGSYGLYDGSNSYYLELSDAAGDFTSPLVIGTGTLNGHRTISGFIPNDIPPGTGYRMRIRSTSPAITSEPFTSIYSLGHLPDPVLSVTSDTIVCSLEPLELSVPFETGVSYQWYKDGNPIPGETGNTIFTDSDGDYQVFTSSGSCEVWSEVRNVSFITGHTYFDTLSICTGGTAVLPDGMEVTAAGNYISVIGLGPFCNDLYFTNISLSPPDTIETLANICSGTSYIAPDGSELTVSGNYLFSIPEAGGCISIEKINLSVTNSLVFENDVLLCDGASYNLPDGTVVDTAGTYPVIFDAGGICVNYTTYVSTGSNTSTIVNVTIEEGSDYILPDGTVVTTAGDYTNIFESVSGCDSVIITHLSVVPFSCDPPVSISTPTINSTSALITWTAEGGATKYQIRYRKVGTVTWTTKSSLTTSKIITGLTASTNYEYQVKTICGASSSSYSSLHTFTTLPMRENRLTQENVMIFPNPTSDYITIYRDNAGERLELEFRDIQGKLIISTILQIGSEEITIDVSRFSSGIYLVQGITDGDRWTKMVSVKH